MRLTTRTPQDFCFLLALCLRVCTVVVVVVFILVSVPSPFTARLWCGGRDKWCPPEDHSHWPPAVAALFGERAKSPKQIKKHEHDKSKQQRTAAPSVTIAPRNPAQGVLNFVVTLTTHKDVRSYPCRSMESAIKLAERFIAGVTKPRPRRPAARNHPGSRCRTGGGVSQHPRLPGRGFFLLANPPVPGGTPCHGLDPLHPQGVCA